MGWSYTTDSLESPTCQLTLQILGLVSLHSFMSQFFLKKSLSIYTHPIAYVSLQSPNLDFDNENSLKEQNFKNEFLNWFWGFLNWLCNLIIVLRLVAISLVSQTVKNLPAMQETQVQKDPLEKGMATHSSILAWKIPWTEEPDGLQSMGLQRGGHD